jgi:hypothetical protein
MAPLMAFTVLRGGIFAERFLYFPTLGFFYAVVSYLSYYSNRVDRETSGLKKFIFLILFFFLLDIEHICTLLHKNFQQKFCLER